MSAGLRTLRSAGSTRAVRGAPHRAAAIAIGAILLSAVATADPVAAAVTSIAPLNPAGKGAGPAAASMRIAEGSARTPEQGAPGGGFPLHPLKLVNVFPPGGSSDVVARLVAQQLGERLGQPVIVENRAGAGGVTGNDYVARQPPDGYTLLLVTGAYPVQAAMIRSLPFDPLRDLQMISLLTSYPFVMDVAPSSPFRSPADLIAAARLHPGRLNYASSGVGSVHHLAAELFATMAGLEMTHVPFRGGSAPMTELIAGRVDLLFEAMTLSLPYLQSGRIRALAVTGRERSARLAGVPALAETLPGYEVVSFLGLATSPGTRPEIVNLLQREVDRMIRTPAVARQFGELGGEPRASSPAEMREFIAAEIAKWKRVIEARRIELQP